MHTMMNFTCLHLNWADSKSTSQLHVKEYTAKTKNNGRWPPVIEICLPWLSGTMVQEQHEIEHAEYSDRKECELL